MRQIHPTAIDEFKSAYNSREENARERLVTTDHFDFDRLRARVLDALRVATSVNDLGSSGEEGRG